MMYVIIGIVLVIVIAITAVLVYKNNQAKIDAAANSAQAAVDTVKTDAVVAEQKAKDVVNTIQS